jgi:Fic family protein
MTLLIKTIKGNKYYYYQDNVVTKAGKNKVVSTQIGSIKLNHLDYTKLVNARSDKLVKHIMSILKAINKSKTTYHLIEYKNNNNNNKIILETLEYLKLVYHFTKINLPPNEEQNYEKRVFRKYVHGTTEIEGNTLSEDEKNTILIKDLTPDGKSVNINEVNEIRNYNLLKGYLDKYTGDITEKLIKKIHATLVEGIIDPDTGKLFIPGKYRIEPAKIRGASHPVSRPENIEEDMKNMIKWYDYQKGIMRYHIIEFATLLHQKFEIIHPFKDYNGRTGREILNFMLTRNGFPPINVTDSLRDKYIGVLEEADFSNYGPIIEFMLERIHTAIQYLFSEVDIINQLVSESFKNCLSGLAGNEVTNEFVTVARGIG